MPRTPLRVDGEGSGNVKTEYPPMLPDQPIVVAAADVEVAMFDQLEYLIHFASQHPGPCDCDLCARFVGVRNLLMKPFAKPERVAKAGA